MSQRMYRIWAAFASAILCILSITSVAQAAEPKRVTTVLTIQPLAPVQLGAPIKIVVQLSTPTGEKIGALNNEAINLFIDGAYVRRARTDRSGTVSFQIRQSLPTGTHRIKVTYEGSQELLASNGSLEFVINSAALEIHLIPALAGVRFSLNGRTFASDKQGTARIEVDYAGTYHLQILPFDTTETNARAEFSRWGDEVFVPQRDVKLPLSRPLEVGFNVSYQARQTFVDLQGHPVDPKRITSLTLKNSLGMPFKFDDGQPRWLQAIGVARRTTGLEETKIQYAVEKVIVDGSNVVNQQQQRFYVNPNDQWSIALLLYSSHFSAQDALFGFPLGSALHIEHPDGHVENLRFTPGAERTIRALVRGIYRVNVVGAPGISPISPVALSRDQDVRLLVISYLNLAIVTLLLASIALGLLFVGRTGLFFLTLRNPLVLLRYIAGASRRVPMPAAVRSAMKSLRRARVYRELWRAVNQHERARALRAHRRVMERQQRRRAHPAPAVRRPAVDLGRWSALLAVPIIGRGLHKSRISTNQYREPTSILQSNRANGRGNRSQKALRRREQARAGQAESATQPVDRLPKRRPLDPIMTFAVILVLLGVVGSLAGFQAVTTEAIADQPEQRSSPASISNLAKSPVATPLAGATARPTRTPTGTATPQPTRTPTTTATPRPTTRPAARPASWPVLSLVSDLQPSSVGNDVVDLQQLLRELGYFVYPENTGFFGPVTLRAVSEFQAAQKLLVTGIVNPRTAQKLNRCDERCVRPANPKEDKR